MGLCALSAFPRATWQPGPGDRVCQRKPHIISWFCCCYGNIRMGASLGSVWDDSPDVCSLQCQCQSVVPQSHITKGTATTFFSMTPSAFFCLILSLSSLVSAPQGCNYILWTHLQKECEAFITLNSWVFLYQMFLLEFWRWLFCHYSFFQLFRRIIVMESEVKTKRIKLQ